MNQESEVLVAKYLEMIMQFGMITMFANSLAIASFFSILTNLLEMKINLDMMTKYSRRFKAYGASGIGRWLGMMEFLAFICIPVNFAIIYFTGDGSWTKSGTSSAEKFLSFYPDFDTKYILLVIVAVEHGFMLLRIGLA